MMSGPRSVSRPSRARVLRLLLGFVALAYLVSWPLWLMEAWAKADASRGGWPFDLGILHLAGSLGPAVAGCAAAGLAGGRAGLKRLVRRVLLWRVAPRWHLVAWLSPFVVLLAAQLLARASGADAVPGSLGASAEFPALPVWLTWLCVLIFYGFGEEIGWRGFALPLLQARFSPLSATLILSLVWALWHWPLFLFTPGLSLLGAAGTAGWFMSLVTGAVLLTWLFNNSGGSVLVAAAFHAAMDIAFLGPPEVAMLVGALTTVAGLAALLAVLRAPQDRPIRDAYDT